LLCFKKKLYFVTKLPDTNIYGDNRAIVCKAIKDNQNIIHKICRLYTDGEDTKDLFQEITIQLWTFLNLEAIANFPLGPIALPKYCHYFVSKQAHHSDCRKFEGGQHFIKDVDYNYEEEEQIKLMYKAVYQLNDIELISFYVS
jgi:RNA polymerase sigma-70 factor (ECF subfamily)